MYIYINTYLYTYTYIELIYATTAFKFPPFLSFFFKWAPSPMWDLQSRVAWSAD